MIRASCGISWTIYTSLQTDNDASTSSLNVLQAGCSSCERTASMYTVISNIVKVTTCAEEDCSIGYVHHTRQTVFTSNDSTYSNQIICTARHRKKRKWYPVMFVNGKYYNYISLCWASPTGSQPDAICICYRAPAARHPQLSINICCRRRHLEANPLATAAAVNRRDRQTNGRTYTQPLHRPCCTYHTGRVNNKQQLTAWYKNFFQFLHAQNVRSSKSKREKRHRV